MIAKHLETYLPTPHTNMSQTVIDLSLTDKASHLTSISSYTHITDVDIVYLSSELLQLAFQISSQPLTRHNRARRLLDTG